MLKKLFFTLIFILLITGITLSFLHWYEINNKISSIEEKIDKMNKITEAGVTPLETAQKGRELTIDMWQVFEQELQDYKQRLREGKQQVSEQQSSWTSLLNELKKSIQEYDKFIQAEGDFWEKQLKNYDKLLARIEERFEILGQCIEELRTISLDLKVLYTAQETKAKEEEKEAQVTEEEKQVPQRRFEKITPQIKGTGEYKTYPPKEEEKEEKTEGEETGQKIIRGTVTGGGDYTTY